MNRYADIFPQLFCISPISLRVQSYDFIFDYHALWCEKMQNDGVGVLDFLL